jgi:hypothetical protein
VAVPERAVERSLRFPCEHCVGKELAEERAHGVRAIVKAPPPRKRGEGSQELWLVERVPVLHILRLSELAEAAQADLDVPEPAQPAQPRSPADRLSRNPGDPKACHSGSRFRPEPRQLSGRQPPPQDQSPNRSRRESRADTEDIAWARPHAATKDKPSA